MCGWQVPSFEEDDEEDDEVLVLTCAVYVDAVEELHS